MTQSLLTIVVFIALLACVPYAVKWAKQRAMGGLQPSQSQAKFISAVAVGPHQRVVIVEVGPEDARVWLTLGVTAQTIQCLHTAPCASKTALSAPTAGSQSLHT